MTSLTGKGPPGQKQGKPKNRTKAGYAHMHKVKQLPCVVCGAPPPSEAHHCRSDGTLKDDFKTISLCRNHHTGADGYHTNKRKWEARNGKDYSFLPIVAAMLKEL